MAKPKSNKLRTLVILRTLFKYSDATHPIGLRVINEQLRPYALECNRGTLSRTLETLEEFGINVSCNTQKYTANVWIKENLFSDEDISCLILALTTNSHISKAQAAQLLEKLKSFVTVYQEPLLKNIVESVEDETDSSLVDVFSVIQEACCKKRKIQYTTDCLKYNNDYTSVSMKQSYPVEFSPKCIYKDGNKLFMVGIPDDDLLPRAVNLKDITSIKIITKPIPEKDMQKAVISPDLFSDRCIPDQKNTIVYQGPITFRFRGRYLRSLFLRFGPPSSQIKRSNRSIITYPIEGITLTSEDLHWLSRIPGFGIRVIGPDAAVEAIAMFYKEVASELVNPTFLPMLLSTKE